MLLAVPNVAAVLMMATLGLAFPLLAAGVVCLYVVAAFAGSRIAPRGPRWLGLGGGPGAVLVLALAPGLVSRWQAEGVANDLRALDIATPASAPPKSIEIREPFASLVPAEPFEAQPCGRECRALLMAGDVEWVRIVRTAGQADLVSAARFRAASGASCPAPETGQGAQARCVIFAPDDGKPADMTIDAAFLERAELASLQPAGPLGPDVRFGRRLTAKVGGNVVFQRTEAAVDVVATPFVIWPASKGMSTGGYEAWRSRRTLAPLSLAEMYAALGFARAMALAPALPQAGTEMMTPPTPDIVNRATSALDLPPVVALNRTHLEFIARWINHARWQKPLPASAIPLVRRILLDPRVTTLGSLNQLLARPEVAPALLTDMLDIVEARKPADRQDAPRQALAALRALSPSQLEPQRARIVRLASGRGPTADAMREVAQRLR